MPYLTPEDLTTHLYPEIIAEITRNDTSITEQAIATATEETRLYLGRYDTLALLGTAATEVTITDALLQNIVKTIACWQLVKLCNVTIDYKQQEEEYRLVIGTLNRIQRAELSPVNWPFASEESVHPSIIWMSQEKRNNQY